MQEDVEGHEGGMTDQPPPAAGELGESSGPARQASEAAHASQKTLSHKMRLKKAI